MRRLVTWAEPFHSAVSGLHADWLASLRSDGNVIIGCWANREFRVPVAVLLCNLRVWCARLVFPILCVLSHFDKSCFHPTGRPLAVLCG